MKLNLVIACGIPFSESPSGHSGRRQMPPHRTNQTGDGVHFVHRKHHRSENHRMRRDEEAIREDRY